MAIFVVEYFVVKRFFLKPINDILEAREVEARTAQQMHEAALAQLKEATDRIEAKMHEERRSASDLRDKFRAEAGAYRGGLIERTTAEAKKLVGEADERLTSDVKEAREKLVRDIESLARLAAEKILGRRV
jgi:F-type H+-transporting ATPase subunit b